MAFQALSLFTVMGSHRTHTGFPILLLLSTSKVILFLSLYLLLLYLSISNRGDLFSDDKAPVAAVILRLRRVIDAGFSQAVLKVPGFKKAFYVCQIHIEVGHARLSTAFFREQGVGVNAPAAVCLFIAIATLRDERKEQLAPGLKIAFYPLYFKGFL